MSCPNQRIRNLAWDPLEQLRREIDLEPIHDLDVRAPIAPEELAILELVLDEDTDTEEQAG